MLCRTGPLSYVVLWNGKWFRKHADQLRFHRVEGGNQAVVDTEPEVQFDSPPLRSELLLSQSAGAPEPSLQLIPEVAAAPSSLPTSAVLDTVGDTIAVAPPAAQSKSMDSVKDSVAPPSQTLRSSQRIRRCPTVIYNPV